MGAAQVTLFGETLIDLTSDTVTADKLASGVTAHDKAGNKITGTMGSNFKMWEVTITSSLPSSGVVHYLVTDTWLAQNRSNPNLCVVVLPKFSIDGDGYLQGVFLGTNMPLVKTGGSTYYSMSSYKHTSNYTVQRMRTNSLTKANDIGDLNITHEGLLYAYAYSPYGFAVGTYAVIAFIV